MHSVLRAAGEPLRGYSVFMCRLCDIKQAPKCNALKIRSYGSGK